MPHCGHNFDQKGYEILTTAVSTLLLIVLFHIMQYIFEMEFGCSCRPGLHLNGVLYLVAPPLILTFIVNLIQPFHRTMTFSSQRYLCCCTRYNNCLTNFFKLLVKCISISAVWVSTVLFDGDWYFCLKTNFNLSQTGIPCKKNLTYEEQLIKNAYKTDSLDFGFYIICGFLCLWSFVEMRRAYCIRKNGQKCCTMSSKGLCPPYYSVAYEELLAMQVSDYLNNELQKLAKERAKVICNPYLEVIKNHEGQPNSTPDEDEKVLDAWEKISAFDLYLMETREEDSQKEQKEQTEQTEQTGQTGQTEQTGRMGQTGQTGQTEQTGRMGQTGQTEIVALHSEAPEQMLGRVNSASPC